MWWNCFPQSATFASLSRSAQLDAAHAAKARRGHRRMRAGARRGSARRSCRSARSGSGCIARRERAAPLRCSVHAVTPAAIPVVHRIRKKYSVGIRTTDAGSARLEGAGAARLARACCSQRTASTSDQRRAMLEALVAAALAATAPMPVMKSKAPKPPAPRCVHAAQRRLADSMPRARSRSIAAITWRAGSPRCRRTC